MHETLLILALQAIRWPSDTTPVIDGRLDEPFWQTIVPAEQFHQVLPQAGLPAPFRTTVRFALDTDNFYIGASLEDPAGSTRQSNVSRRDHIPDTDDTLTIILDPLGTRVFGQLFQVNPDCATSDGLYKEASLSTDFSTDFHYTVACHQSDRGWTVEFKIPLQELRFAQDNTQPWNVLVQRSLVRDQRRTVANAPLPRDPVCLLCFAPALDRPAALPEPYFLRLTPYALFRRTDRT
ncbi:MAG: carbohydrate binding family 9 domain-containing protein, partial [Pseudobdellovibrionaceae bacterium]|nr:carbohydrate binding family 9 domain-containing protein [Pseudobdellovibrionaceae bacterium]